MAHQRYRTKFFKIGVGKLFLLANANGNGTFTGPFPRLNDRNYVTSSGTITKIGDQSKNVAQYP